MSKDIEMKMEGQPNPPVKFTSGIDLARLNEMDTVTFEYETVPLTQLYPQALRHIHISPDPQREAILVAAPGLEYLDAVNYHFETLKELYAIVEWASTLEGYRLGEMADRARKVLPRLEIKTGVIPCREKSVGL